VERLGLVGLPNAGKSTLFNALTGMAVTVAPHPFSTTETTVGIAAVPDDRLDRLAEMSKSKKVVHATVEVTDIAALVKGASTGEGLGNRFLGSLREVDALAFVVRSFLDDNVPGSTDPADALATLELELVVADLGSVQARLDRQRKAARADRALAPEVAALERAEAALDEGVPLYRSGLGDDDRRLLVPAFLLTNKPVLVVVNVGDDQLDGAEALAKEVADDAVAVCAQLEMEAARLDPSERSEMLAGLGLGAGVVPRVAAAAYRILGRRTFLTTGDKESRAWTVRSGAKAPDCAGVIHSDLQRGFIRAEVIHWDELLELGSWAKAKEAGRIRLEGKDYEVKDGDVLEIRFNV
jgi:GTP-binding protein YchF